MKKNNKLFGMLMLALLCTFTAMPTLRVQALGDKDLTAAEMSSAEEIKMGTDYTEKTVFAEEPITHKVTVDKNGVLGITVTKPDEGNGVFSHHFLVVYNGNGQEIMHLAHNDTKEHVVEFHVGVMPGTYYFKTKSINTKDSFSFKCSFEATDYAEKERNDSKETATPIETDTEYTGYFGGASSCDNEDKKDLYKVNLIEGVTYRFVHEGTDEIHPILKKDAALDFWGDICNGKDFVAPYTGEFYVLFYNNNHNQYKYTFMIKTVNAAPKASAITSLKAAKKSFTAKWKVVSCDGYELQYGLKSNFKSAKIKDIPSGKKNIKIKGLKSGKKYYVRIRTYRTINGTKYYSKWSGKKNVKVK